MSFNDNDKNQSQLDNELVELAEGQIAVLQQKLSELSKLVADRLSESSPSPNPSVQQRWSDAVEKMLLTEPGPSVWIREANIQNLADGGQSLEMDLNIVDNAWISFLPSWDSLLVHHRYEVDFYEKGSVRGRITVTFSIWFDLDRLDWDLDDLESREDIPYDLTNKTHLYQHSWPHLKKYIEKTVEDFWWNSIDFPGERVETGLPLSTGEIQRLHY